MAFLSDFIKKIRGGLGTLFSSEARKEAAEGFEIAKEEGKKSVVFGILSRARETIAPKPSPEGVRIRDVAREIPKTILKAATATRKLFAPTRREMLEELEEEAKQTFRTPANRAHRNYLLQRHSRDPGTQLLYLSSCVYGRRGSRG